MLLSKSDIKLLVPRFATTTADDIFAAHVANIKQYKLPEVFSAAIIADMDALVAPVVYSASVDYAANVVVYYGGLYYKSDASITHGATLPGVNSHWILVTQELYLFWINYVKAYYTWEFFADFMTYHGVAITQAGAFNLNSDNHVEISDEGRKLIIEDARIKANYERKKMMDAYYTAGCRFDGTTYTKVTLTAKSNTGGVRSIGRKKNFGLFSPDTNNISNP